MLASFVGASFGITEMIFFAPALVELAFAFGPADICSLMLLGLLAGSTLAKGSPLKGVAMTVLGLLLGLVGTDINSGEQRFTFDLVHLNDGIEIVALALGIFGMAEFLKSVNRIAPLSKRNTTVRLREMRRHGP
jgi:putative tricarboxylic transport membrane protein